MSYNDLIREAFKIPSTPAKEGAVLDSCGEKCKDGKCKDEEGKALDGVSLYDAQDIALQAAAVIQQWAETDDGDLDEGESLSDRLYSMMVGVADSNKDGELTEDESIVIQAALEAAYEYLISKGVSEADASELLNDWTAESANRVKDYLAGELPDGDQADADIDNFAFGEDQSGVFDSVNAVFDATYKKVLAVRGGKKIRINKRISGTVRLSAKQKMAIRKARMKSHSAAAVMRRRKSMRLRKKAGL